MKIFRKNVKQRTGRVRGQKNPYHKRPHKTPYGAKAQSITSGTAY